MEIDHDNMFGDQVQAYSFLSRREDLIAGGDWNSHILADTGPAGQEAGAFETKKAIWGELDREATDDTKLSAVRSLPADGEPPMAVVFPEGIWYENVSPDDASRIVNEHIIGGEPVEDLRFDPGHPDDFKLVVVCTFISQCGPEGGGEVLKHFNQESRDSDVHVVQSYGCLKECSMGPVAASYPDGQWYAGLDEYKLDEVWDAIETGSETQWGTGKLGQ